jgi:DNA-binding NarL/FixJ family response regulator
VAKQQRHTRVYYVEDCVEVRTRVSRELASIDGIELVGCAERAPEAIACIRRSRPDVVVLDLHLQEGTGMDILRELRNDHQPPLMIVLTNQSDPTSRERSRKAGARHYFDKSTEFHEFLTILTQLGHVW